MNMEIGKNYELREDCNRYLTRNEFKKLELVLKMILILRLGKILPTRSVTRYL